MMNITWYGTASVLIETSATSLIFDPFLKYLPEKYEPEELQKKREKAFRKEQNILITHGHFDHLSSVPSLYRNAPCMVYLTDTPAKTLIKQGFPDGKIHRIVPGDLLRFSDVTVHVYHGRHVHFDAKLILQKVFSLNSWKQFKRVFRLLWLNIHYPQNDEIVFYEVEAEGKRIQIMGSADLADEVEYPTGADVLVLPHQGRSDIDAHNREIVGRLKPGRILLDHYDDAFPPISELVSVDEFCREMSGTIPTEKMIEGKRIKI